MNGDSIFFDWDLPLGFLVAPLEFCSIFHSERILRRPFGICQSRFLLVRDLLGMLPALQNSGRAKWGSARADRILKSRVSEKMGSPLQESANLQMSTAAPDFCFSRAQRLWDVICAIWDLLRCTAICKSAVIEFSAGREIYFADFSPLI